jgi:hypothetical protein
MTEYFQASTEILGVRDLWAIMFGDRHDTLELVSVRPNDAWTTAKYGHFSYPDQVDQAEQWVLTHSVGRNVWHCAHLLMSPRKTTGATPRTKDNASNVVCLYADLDGSPLPDDLPRPTAIVQSSPGKMHCYWRLTRPLQPQDAERLNRRIAYAIKDDLSGWDLTQLLRVPDTFNFKYETAQPVTITHLDPSIRYDPIKLAELLPPAPDEAKPAAPTPDAVPVNLPDSVLIAMARERQPKFNRLWTGDLSDYIDDQHPEGNRSRADAGFCTIAAGWTGKDPARINTWWLAAPGLKRDKLDRDDYRAKTIAFGIKECGWVYNPDGPTLEPTPLEQIEASGSDGADSCPNCETWKRIALRLQDEDAGRKALRSSKWSGQERIALEHLGQRNHDAQRRGRAEVKLYLEKETKLCGVPKATLSRTIKKLEQLPPDAAIPFTITRGKTRNGLPQISLIPKSQRGTLGDDWRTLAAVPQDDRPTHGGRRAGCPDHPTAKLRVHRVTSCTICGQVVDDNAKHPTYIEPGSPGTTEAGETPSAPPNPIMDAIDKIRQRRLGDIPPEDDAADQEQADAAEAYFWRPDEPNTAPFQDETVQEPPSRDCGYKGQHLETVESLNEPAAEPLHDETPQPVRPPVFCQECQTAEAGPGGYYCATCMEAYYEANPWARPVAQAGAA